jgi:hypothetical protein
MPLGSGSVRMSRGRDIVISDDFARAGAPLGEARVSDIPWKQINASDWTANNRAITATADTNNPMAVIPTEFSDIDMSVNISGVGGDCLYFRVVDSSNWWRLRYTETTNTYTSGCTTCSGTSCSTCTVYGTISASCCGCEDNTECGASQSVCGSCPGGDSESCMTGIVNGSAQYCSYGSSGCGSAAVRLPIRTVIFCTWRNVWRGQLLKLLPSPWLMGRALQPHRVPAFVFRPSALRLPIGTMAPRKGLLPMRLFRRPGCTVLGGVRQEMQGQT